jgi:hypothetical protein
MTSVRIIGRDGRTIYQLDVTPCPAPRQTQQDQWRVGARARPAVARYHEFRDAVAWEWRGVF